jgi:hypothetical protein
MGWFANYPCSYEAIADSYDSCAATSVPAADVEGCRARPHPEPARCPRAGRPKLGSGEARDGITEREITVLLGDFATVWNELFPAEQARIVQLLVERVDVQEDALEVWIRAEGLVSLVSKLQQQGERKAA